MRLSLKEQIEKTDGTKRQSAEMLCLPTIHGTSSRYSDLFIWMVDKYDGLSLLPQLHQVGPPVGWVLQQV